MPLLNAPFVHLLPVLVALSLPHIAQAKDAGVEVSRSRIAQKVQETLDREEPKRTGLSLWLESEKEGKISLLLTRGPRQFRAWVHQTKIASCPPTLGAGLNQWLMRFASSLCEAIEAIRAIEGVRSVEVDADIRTPVDRAAALIGAGKTEDALDQLHLHCSGSAEQHDPDAYYLLAQTYMEGKGIAQDYGEAASWLQKAADRGLPLAQRELGLLYRFGEGVKQDPNKAALWIRRAADQGHPAGQFSMGILFSEGIGMQKDLTQAAAWYTKAAEQGDTRAQCNLGMLYEEGSGVTQDYKQAANWYEKAVQVGDPVGQRSLAVLIATGSGVERDLRRAIALFDKAAEQGDQMALNNLAWMLSTSADPTILDPVAALHAAERLVALDPASWRSHDTHAAALARSGEFENAAEAQEKALSLARAAPQIDHAAIGRMEGRLQLYKSRKPYSE